MAKHKPTDQKAENIQIAKIEFTKAIIVAVITAGLGVGLPAYFVGRKQGKDTSPPQPTLSHERKVAGTDSRGDKENNPVIMLGSGTVFRYLGEFFGREGKKFQVLEGPTEAAASIFASSNNAPINVLLMASEPLPLGKLTEYSEQHGAIFEVYLGADRLQLLYLYEKNIRVNGPDSDDPFLKTKRMSFADLRKWWEKGNYDIYAGSEKSGTRACWEHELFGAGQKVWPGRDNPHTTDIRTDQILDYWHQTPGIYLESEVVNSELARKIGRSNMKEISTHLVNMVDDKGKEVKRGLYLYGWIRTDDLNVIDGGGGYKLPKPVAEILLEVFAFLEVQKAGFISRDCIKSQKNNFHLKNGEGWIGKLQGNQKIYQQSPVRR